MVIVTKSDIEKISESVSPKIADARKQFEEASIELEDKFEQAKKEAIVSEINTFASQKDKDSKEEAKESLFLKYQSGAKPGLESREVFEEVYEKMKADFLSAPKHRRQPKESYQAALLMAGIEGTYISVEILPEQEPAKPAIQHPQPQQQHRPEPKKDYSLNSLMQDYAEVNQYKLNAKAECLEAFEQIKQKPNLAEKILKALLTAGSIGLSIRPALKQGWIATRGNVTAFEPMYQGLLDIAIADNVISYAEAREVCSNDVFRAVFGTTTIVEHIPPISGRGEICGVYAHLVIPTTTGTIDKFEVLDDQQCEKFKRIWGANGRTSPAVRDHLEMMLRKSVLKRALKCLRTSERLSLAIAIDNDNDDYSQQEQQEEKKKASDVL